MDRLILFASLSASIFLWPAGGQADDGPAPAIKAAMDGAFDSGDLDLDNSSLKPLIERYTVDRGTVTRFAPPAASPGRDERLVQFTRTWMDRLESIHFGELDRVSQVDYLLFKNHLKHELRLLDTAAKERVVAAPFLPFAGPILDLDRARKELGEQDWKVVAGKLNDLSRAITEARKSLEGKSRKDLEAAVDRPSAARAVPMVESLRSTLEGWYRFYDGYDPMFTWWNSEPYKAADEALRNYATLVRDRLGAGNAGSGGNGGMGGEEGPGGGLRRGGGGGFPGGGGAGGPGAAAQGGGGQGAGGRGRAAEVKEDGSDIVGRPIGREALLSELAYEMINYTPEELIAIAEAERERCLKELIKAAQEMGLGNDWKAAIEKVKDDYVAPGDQPRMIRDKALQAIEYMDRHNLVTIPQLARDSWRMAMMSPEQQLVSPFFTGGETITVSFPTNGMAHEAKMMSLRGNNVHFSHATVFHEVIPGHHLQGYMNPRYKTYRALFSTPFSVEGWALYWELILWDRGFGETPEDRVGMLFWRMHRCNRILFSLKFHMNEWTPKQCIDLLVDGGGHEKANAVAEVRRSFAGGYGPLYQAAYMLGGLQLYGLHRDLVKSGKMTDRTFHDAILKQNRIPIAMVRAALTDIPLKTDEEPAFKFYGPIPGKE
ncbi:MAG: DUF885 family protein [Isosphaeraceae bacterium]